MAFKSFKEMMNKLKGSKKARVSIAAADNKEVLESIKIAYDEGIILPYLFGDKNKIQNILKELDFIYKDVEIINTNSIVESVEKAVKYVKDGNTDIIMKGMVDSSQFMKGVLHSEYGLRTEKILSHLAAFEIPEYNKMLFITDGGINIKPDLSEKVEIIKNSIEALHSIGYEKPNVGIIAAVEAVNTKMKATTDAAIISKMADRGQVKGALVDGPLALDNAINERSAKLKGINSPVAGKVDLLLTPDIETGNTIGKTLMYFAKSTMAGIVLGARAPIVLTSRADTSYGKLCSIALASLASSYNHK